MVQLKKVGLLPISRIALTFRIGIACNLQVIRLGNDGDGGNTQKVAQRRAASGRQKLVSRRAIHLQRRIFPDPGGVLVVATRWLVPEWGRLPLVIDRQHNRRACRRRLAATAYNRAERSQGDGDSVPLEDLSLVLDSNPYAILRTAWKPSRKQKYRRHF